MLITNKLKKPTNGAGSVILLRGTFSPIHSGHLHALDLAREFIEKQSHKLLGEYLSPMHYKDEMEKLGDDSIPTYHRLNMIRAVLDRQDSLMLFDWECHQDEPADTLEVTEQFKSRLVRSVPELSEDKLQLYYVCGMDSIPKGISDSWFKRYNLLCVVNREGEETRFDELKKRFPDRVHKIKGETRNVRSEMIRETLKEAQDLKEEEKVKKISDFVELEEVAKYIVKHNLWDNKEKEKGVDHSELFPTIFKNFGLYNSKIGNNQFWVEKAMNTEMGKPKFIVSVLNSDNFEMKYFIGNVTNDTISEDEIEFNINTLSNLSKVLHMSEQEEDTLEEEALQHSSETDEFGGRLKVTITHHLRIPKTGKCTYYNEMFPDYRWFILPFYNSNSDDLDFATKTKYLAYGMAKYHMASSLVSVSRTTELNIKEMRDACQKLVKLDKKFDAMANWLSEFEQSALYSEWEYLPKMYVHNDFQPKNILVRRKEQLTTVFIIDAEGGIFGPRIFDLYFLLLWNDQAEGLNEDNYPNKFRSVMRVYQQHAPTLTPTEKRLLAPALTFKSIMTATAVGNEAVNPDCVAPQEVLQDVLKGHFRGFDMLTRVKSADELVQIIDGNKKKKTTAA